jgi:hypothetical protein
MIDFFIRCSFWAEQIGIFSIVCLSLVSHEKNSTTFMHVGMKYDAVFGEWVNI